MAGGVAWAAAGLAAGGGGAAAADADSTAPVSGIEALRRDYDVVLLPPDGRWAPELVAALRAGLERLPPALRRFPGGPLEVELHEESSAHGMGDGSAARPEWTGRRRFHLYAYLEPADRRAAYRLERLAPGEREALWRQRAMVHAAIQRWDDALRLSERETWRRLNGWLRPLERPLTWSERPLNTYAWGYSRARGMSSASLDLVTFAEEALVPVESMRADALEVDDTVRCQELSKSRFLREALAAAGLGEVLPRGSCPAFDAWAEPASLSHFEVLLVAASGRAPESLFGHIMLRPVRRPQAVVQGPSFGTVVQLAALTGADNMGMGYVLRGLTGGYALVTLTTTLGDVRLQMLESEQRTLRRFRIRLTESERLRLLERIWESERRGYLEYFFLTDNCATALVLLLNGALEEGRKIRLPPRYMPVGPTSALDAMARVEGEERAPSGEVVRGPLLVHIPDALESSHDAAARAHERREETWAELRARLPESEREAFARVHARVQSFEPRARREAYEQLPALVERLLASATGEAREALARGLYAYLAHAVTLERYAVDRAEDERLKVLIASLKPDAIKLTTGDEERAARQRLFERESFLLRQRAELFRAQALREFVERSPRRALTPAESEVVSRAAEVSATLDRLIVLQGELIDRHFSSSDPMAWLEEETAVKVERARRGLEGALSSSGHGRTLVGGGIALPWGGAAVPLLSLRSALFWEQLGDQRVHGLQPGSEIQVLTGEIQLRPRWGLPELYASEVTLGAFRTLMRDLPLERRDLLDELGWGFRVGWGYRAGRELPQRGQAHAELIAPLDAGHRFARFTALGLGLAGDLRWGGAEARVGLGPRLSLAHRSLLFGWPAGALRFEGAYAPSLLLGRTLAWSQAASASAGLEVQLGRLGPWTWVLRPQVSLDWERGDPAPLLRASMFAELL